jgi:CheY-like chemotaxis protein
VDVLVVDEDVDSAMFVVHMLSLRLCTLSVIAARTSDDALQLAERDPPSLVLVSLRMPGINGLELARRLKARIGSNVKVVIMTRENANRIPHNNVDGVLLKPFSLDALCQLVKSILNCDTKRDDNINHVVLGGLPSS